MAKKGARLERLRLDLESKLFDVRKKPLVKVREQDFNFAWINRRFADHLPKWGRKLYHFRPLLCGVRCSSQTFWVVITFPFSHGCGCGCVESISSPFSCQDCKLQYERGIHTVRTGNTAKRISYRAGPRHGMARVPLLHASLFCVIRPFRLLHGVHSEKGPARPRR